MALIGLLVITNTGVFAQGQPAVKDSTSTTFSFRDLSLPDPESIESKYEYDARTNRYRFSQTLDNYSVRYPLYLTPEQFQEKLRKEQIRDYFKEKSNAISAKDEESKEGKKNLLPIYYVNSGFFESVFGSNEIEIVPQGSVEVDLGVLFNKQDNPSFSPQNQSNFSFDFDQRISLSLQGNVGTRLSVLANFDTESTFDFQNQLKLQYNPTEDDIVQAIEVGNVSLPLNSSLIQGAQSLFGVKADLQFGKTRVTGVFSEQRSDTRSVTVQGGGTIEDFEIFALDYDENRHYFLSQYFRDTYDEALEQYPYINSNIQITRIQVWVTNSANNASGITNSRNIVALQDLGESNPNRVNVSESNFIVSTNELPDNGNNRFDPERIDNGTGFLTPAIRDIGLLNQAFTIPNVNEGTDYSRLESARLLTESQYDLNTQLGYISLNQRLSNDEVIGVAFQYTRGGQVFQVGEFANDGISNTTTGTEEVADSTQEELSTSQALVVKLLKSSITSVEQPVWDLMMKNIYNLGAFRLSQDGFKMNILFTDPSPVNFIRDVNTGEFITGTNPIDDTSPTLLKLFRFDSLNVNNDPVNGGDGFFDYYPGITIDEENGRIIFTKVEPFGLHLFNELSASGVEDYENELTYNPNQQEYVFNQLYSETKTQAEQLQAERNNFQLKGSFKTTGQNGISIGAFNVPRGSVTVTAGGRVLQEGLDYTVNYQLGRVEILNEALTASNTPINITTENSAVFGQQTKRYSGVNVEHQFSQDFVVGGTLINVRERPLTQKSNFNFEPINNTIVGLNANYSREVPLLTRLVNKLPNIDTEAPSRFSFRGEFAYLFADSPRVADFEGEVTSNIDDFEAAQTAINLASPLSWELSSVPEGFDNGVTSGVESGFRRGGLSWYTIDPVFYGGLAPSEITDAELSRPQTRLVTLNEIFEEREVDISFTQSIFTFDVSYRPNERGAYNYNPNSFNAGDNFGGITRALSTNDFEQANIQFIEFWVMDPYEGGISDGYVSPNNAGEIRFNIGSISEDVLRDGRKQYENGLPEQLFPYELGEVNTDYRDGEYGRIPTDQSLIYSFDNAGNERTIQDVGFDGLNDSDEILAFGTGFGEDPSNDNYEYFLQATGNIEERYLRYNGTQGNSPVDVSDDNRGRTTVPTVEDVNRDNTMNTIDQYFEYVVDMSPEALTLANPLVSDQIVQEVGTPDGGSVNVRWVQFRVPLSDADVQRFNGQGAVRPQRTTEPSDLRSANFMRMYMTGFEDDILLRFATLDLVRGDYRSYDPSPSAVLDTSGLNNSTVDADDTTLFSVSSVSLESNSDIYVIPPGVEREELNTNNTLLSQDEGSLALVFNDLQGTDNTNSSTLDDIEGDARAAYKNFNIDMRQYENLEMFIHADDYIGSTLEDGEAAAIIRIGTDFNENFYQIELPLKVTPEITTVPEDVWPEENQLDLPLTLLQDVKTRILALRSDDSDLDQQLIYNNDLIFFDESLQESTGAAQVGQLRVGIKGNPSFGNVKVIMLGVKNNTQAENQPINGQVWFNELRLSGLKNQGGWAATASIDANVADFATVSASGKRSTIGFGSVEQGPNERDVEDVLQYGFTTNVNVGQLLPKKWGVRIPVTYSRSEELITPQFDPLNDDLILEDVIAQSLDPEAIEEQSTEYTKRQSVSVIGLRKERTSDRKPRVYDVENFTASGTYNQTDYRDFEIEESLNQTLNLNGSYNYSFQPLNVEPFKKSKFLSKNKYLKFIKDFNLNLLPTSISASTGLNRSFNRQIFRDVSLTEESFGTPALTQRNYLFDWQYGVQYDLTKSFNFNFSASVNRVVTNYIDEDNNVNEDIRLWDGLGDLGDPNTLNQTLQANYELPLKKFPALSFIKSTYSYTGDFQWRKGSETLSNLEVETGAFDSDGNAITERVDLGNTIQNSSTHRLNTTFDLKKFYKNVGLVKKKSNRKKTKKKKKKEGVENNLAPRTIASKKKLDPRKLSTSNRIYNGFIGAITAVKRLNINYQQDAGTVLPGYTNSIGAFGSLDPSASFAFGIQDDVRSSAAQQGFLTTFDSFNEQYQNRESSTLTAQATIDLLPGLKIDVTANRAKSETYSENFIIENGIYQSLSPTTTGNFSVSTILLKTSFQRSTRDASKVFDDFRNNRLIIANRLAGSNVTERDTNGFPVGFSQNNQAVLLPAFLAAYTGNDASDEDSSPFRDIPLPNWNLRYNGFLKLKWFKKRFKRFTVSHGYRSDFTINRFQTNLDFAPGAIGEDQFDAAGDFKNEILYGNVNLTEQFSPLIKIDLETKSSIKVSTEIRRDRALSFSFDNNLLTEVSGEEYILGLGYRIKDIKFTTTLGSLTGRRKTIKSDLNLKADFSLRSNETVVRFLDVDNNQVTSGQDIYSFRFTSDYALSKNLTAIFFYDHSFSEFSVSTAFPQTNIRSGFTMRYNF